MKRFLVSVFFPLLVAFLFITPHIVTSSPRTRSFLRDVLKKELHAHADFSGLTWYWFPFPHLAFLDTRITSPDFSLKASLVGIYPDWLSLMSGTFAVSGMDLDDCHFVLKRLGKEKNSTLILPKHISVTNGFFEVSKGVGLPFLPFKDKRPYIKDLYGSLDIRGKSLSVDIRGNTRQAASIELRGEADIEGLSYDVKGRIHQLDLSALKLKRVPTIRQFPTYGFVNLEFDVTGKGLEKSKGNIRAYSNCVIAKAKRRPAIFSCGSLVLKYSYEKELARIVLENLDFQRPGLHLKGKARVFKRNGRYWAMADLSGYDLDLGQIRDALEALAIKDEDVEDFCTAIRRGTVEHARLHMDAPLSKWHSLSDMYITGRARDVKIYVKDEDFFVDSASGPFEIKDGVLYVQGATARLRDTTGRDGRLVLGLSKGRDQFKLDIGLNAPAQDVRWALLKFTHEKRLHQELGKLSRLMGRLQGRLLMGDRKHHKKVKVLVKETRLSCFYETLGMDVKIKGGGARYQEDTLSVFGVSGSVGPNHVEGLGGRLSWKDDLLKVSIERAKGRFMAESLLSLLKRFDIQTAFLQEKAIDVSGPFALNRLRLNMGLDDPWSMKYLVSLSPMGMNLRTNMLPGPLYLKGGSLQVSDKRVSMRGFKARLGRDWLKLNADLSHHGFKNWKGFVKSSGVVRRRLWAWLEERGLEMDEFTLRLPFYARDFKVEFRGPHNTGFEGGLEWKKAGVRLDLKVAKGQKSLDIERLELSSAGTACTLGFHRRGLKEQEVLSFSFKGRLNGDILNDILLKNAILSGQIEGDFAWAFSLSGEKRAYDLRGDIDVSGLNWVWGPVSGLTLKRLRISAKNGRGGVGLTLAFLGDIVEVNGTFEIRPGRLLTDFDLYASKLSSKTFGIIQEFSNNGALSVGRSGPVRRTREESDLFAHMVKGLDVKLNFNIEEVRYAVTEFAKNRAGNPHELILRHLKGSALVEKKVLRRLEAYSDDTCGLDLYLKKQNEKGLVFSEFSAITPPGQAARFEEVLDCLGIKQDLITGPVTMNLYLRGKDRVLLGDGYLKIKAKDGSIHKFGLLSKIFSVVNIVDIFSLNKGLLEGTSPYKRLLVDAKIKSGSVHMEKAYVKGQGINFYATGDVYLDKKSLELIIFIQPLKTVDKIITSLPIIGGIIGGENKSLFAIPVKVSGKWSDPEIDMLQARTVTDIFKKLIFNVLTAPFSLKP